MEDRRWRRDRFYNPFVRKQGSAKSDRPMFMGFLRSCVVHRWPLTTALALFEYTAARPLNFGLPDAPTCVVNTSMFLPSARGRSQGITVFGPERGCKTLVVPPSCSGHNFDSTDAKMLEPLFRWNPSLETIYLSKHCEDIAAEIGQMVSKHRNLKTLILPDWDNALAINRLALPPKNLEMIDIYCPVSGRKDWGNEIAVEAWAELFEMHPKLKGVAGTTDVLHTVSEATRFCRCKHNVALVPTACVWTRFYRHMWFAGLCVAAYILAAASFELAQRVTNVKIVRDFSFPVVLAIIVIGGVTMDLLRLHNGGRSWCAIAKVWMLIRRRIDPITRV